MDTVGVTRRDLLKVGATGVALTALGGVGLAAGKPEYELVILNGRVIDPETKLDAIRHLAIDRGTIRAVTSKEVRGQRTVDAKGLVVAPGFIDPISHGQDLENDRVQVLDGVTTKLQMEVGVRDLPQWYAQQAGHRMANYGAGTSHTIAREVVLGGEDAAAGKVATDGQVHEMMAFVDHGLRQGGLGVGFGLEYQPASRRWEVLQMFQVAGRYGASCHVHTRYGTMMEEQSNFTAVEEVLAASIASGAPIHIVHVPSMALRNTERVLEFIHNAQRHGIDVTCDFYPYTAFGTGIGTEVFSEGWQQRFGIDYGDLEWGATHERLTPETFEKYRKQGGFVMAHAIPESAVRAAVKSPATMVGTDGGLSKGVGHPRSAGAYSRILGRYVREQRLISLMEAIDKMSLRPARRFEHRCAEFRKKGRIQPGMDADLAIFDPKTVIDRATFDHPALPSEGFHHVFVNGVPVVRDGKLVENARPGRGLRAREV